MKNSTRFVQPPESWIKRYTARLKGLNTEPSTPTPENSTGSGVHENLV
jgi:hypothetical protein